MSSNWSSNSYRQKTREGKESSHDAYIFPRVVVLFSEFKKEMMPQVIFTSGFIPCYACRLTCIAEALADSGFFTKEWDWRQDELIACTRYAVPSYKERSKILIDSITNRHMHTVLDT